MNELRLFLLVCGISLIAGIYIWGNLQGRKKQRQQTIQPPLAKQDIPELKIETGASSEIDYSSALDGLKQSIAESREFEADSTANRLASHDEDSSSETIEDIPAQLQQEAAPKHEEFVLRQSPTENVAKSDVTPTERIIILHIIPRAREKLEGPAILRAVNELEMQHGEMDVFHHYGVGEMKMEQALFSLANMVEPGNFDITSMHSFSTPGLVMFMCLPSIIDAQVIFELMLNTAQRLADMLSADVCDDRRNLVTEEKLEEIRGSLQIS